MILVEETVQRGQLRWTGHVYSMEDDERVERVFKARRMEREDGNDLYERG